MADTAAHKTPDPYWAVLCISEAKGMVITMTDKKVSGPIANLDCIREAVCVHTSKVLDSCRDKDCVEDLRVYCTEDSQSIIDASVSVRPRSAKLLFADVDVEEINFNRGCYTVDVTYFYKVTGEAFPGEAKVTGLCVFEKRVVLYGSEGTSKIFTSNDVYCNDKNYSSLPTAVVEAVDPLILSMKIVNRCKPYCSDRDLCDIPCAIAKCFCGDIVSSHSGKQLYATLGQFSIISLERDTQLLMPAYDYCVPTKECVCVEEDPCTLFSHIPFPMDDFFPPKGSPEKCGQEACVT